MTDQVMGKRPDRGYFLHGHARTIAIGLTGVVAICVALQAVLYVPSADPLIPNQDHLFRLIAFASLTVWTTLTIGLSRRGIAAMITLAFASFLDLVIVPVRAESMMGTLASANLGIVFAYCGLQLYWNQLLAGKKRTHQDG